MIRCGFGNEEHYTIILVFEPSNFVKFRAGRPMRVNLGEFPGALEAKSVEIMLGFTPDVEYIQEQIGEGVADVNTLLLALQSAKDRPEIIRTDQDKAAMPRVQ